MSISIKQLIFALIPTLIIHETAFYNCVFKTNGDHEKNPPKKHSTKRRFAYNLEVSNDECVKSNSSKSSQNTVLFSGLAFWVKKIELLCFGA